MVVPDSTAEPLLPRSLTQRTRYMNLLSLASPAMPITPVASMAVCEEIATIGATLSIVLHFRRCAWSSSVLLSTAAAFSWSPPPHPAKARQATACAIISAVWFIFSFMSNGQ